MPKNNIQSKTSLLLSDKSMPQRAAIIMTLFLFVGISSWLVYRSFAYTVTDITKVYADNTDCYHSFYGQADNVIKDNVGIKKNSDVCVVTNSWLVPVSIGDYRDKGFDHLNVCANAKSVSETRLRFFLSAPPTSQSAIHGTWIASSTDSYSTQVCNKLPLNNELWALYIQPENNVETRVHFVEVWGS